jgi:hypothetical protein
MSQHRFAPQLAAHGTPAAGGTKLPLSQRPPVPEVPCWTQTCAQQPPGVRPLLPQSAAVVHPQLSLADALQTLPRSSLVQSVLLAQPHTLPGMKQWLPTPRVALQSLALLHPHAPLTHAEPVRPAVQLVQYPPFAPQVDGALATHVPELQQYPAAHCPAVPLHGPVHAPFVQFGLEPEHAVPVVRTRQPLAPVAHVTGVFPWHVVPGVVHWFVQLTHVPLWHVAPVAHTLPQLPQLFVSLVVSTQELDAGQYFR